MSNGAVSSACCCDVEPLICRAWDICKYEEQDACDLTPTLQPLIPGYVSIGRPLGPTLYKGPFWVGWHNSVTSKEKAKVQVQLNIRAYRRVIVQDSISPPNCTSCPVTLPIPDAKLNCIPTTIPMVPGCARTEYIDNFSYEMTGEFDLIGGSKDQAKCGYGVDNSDPGVPPGPWPFKLCDYDRTGLTPDEPVVIVDNDPRWWPSENRRLVPRFFGQATITSSAVPSMEFPQIAACGAVQHVDRCTNVTVQSTASVCFDAPLTVVPGHTTLFDQGDINRCLRQEGCPGCGFPVIGEPGSGLPAASDQPWNGAEEAAWGVDIYELGLKRLMETMYPADHAYIGSLDEVWSVQTHAGRTRLLYGTLSRLDPDEVLRFPDGVQKTEIHEVDFKIRGHSVAMRIELRITPIEWCKATEDCAGLCVYSWCENGPSTINVAFYQFGKLGPGSCGDGDALSGSMTLGLCRYQIPFCAIPEICVGSATTGCMQYPVNTPCIARDSCGNLSYDFLRSDYVGSKPVERAHFGWKRFRNQYDETCCLNGGCTAGQTQFPCTVFGYNITGNGALYLEVGPEGVTGPLFDMDCMDPNYDGVLDCNPQAPGFPWPSNCPGGYGPPGNNCCSEFCDEQGQVFPGPCARVSIDPDFLGFWLSMVPPYPPVCSNFFKCGGSNFAIEPYFGNGASPSIYYCDSPCVTSSIGGADLWVDWDPTWSCGPIGTWPLYFGNTCYPYRPVPREMRAGKVVVS